MALADNAIIKSIQDYRYQNRSVVAGAIHIYRGSLLNSNAAGDVKISSDAAAELFAGVSMEEVEQSATALAGDNNPQLIAPGSGDLVLLKFTGVGKAHLGLPAYVKADDEVQLASAATNDVLVGTIRSLEATNYCWVQI